MVGASPKTAIQDKLFTKRALKLMRRYFVTGLVILLPVATTIFVILFIVNLLTNPFMGMAQELLTRLGWLDFSFLFLSREQLIRYGSQLLILAMLIGFTVGLGVIARWFFINSLIRTGEMVLQNIPLVNRIYRASKDIIETLFQSQHNAFREVVIVPFPTPGIYSLGFISRVSPPELSTLSGESLTSVFVPTTPNPTSGYLMMFKEKDIIHTKIPVEEAVKFIISCGVIHPSTENAPPVGGFTPPPGDYPQEGQAKDQN